MRSPSPPFRCPAVLLVARLPLLTVLLELSPAPGHSGSLLCLSLGLPHTLGNVATAVPEPEDTAQCSCHTQLQEINNVAGKTPCTVSWALVVSAGSELCSPQAQPGAGSAGHMGSPLGQSGGAPLPGPTLSSGSFELLPFLGTQGLAETGCPHLPECPSFPGHMGPGQGQLSSPARMPPGCERTRCSRSACHLAV